MQEGWLEFAMHAPVAETILALRRELDYLIYQKMENPKLEILQENRRLLNAILELLHGDKNEGRFSLAQDPPKKAVQNSSVICVKSLLNNRLSKAGYKAAKYTVKALRNKTFQASVVVKGKHFKGKVDASKKQAENNAAADALEWLDGLAIAAQEKKEARKAAKAKSTPESH